LTADLNKAARTFAVYVDGVAVAFTAALWRPVSKTQRTGGNLMGLSRTVTHPDWQGLGLAMLLTDTVAAAYKAIGRRMHSYPAHPVYIRARDRSPNWALIGRPGFGRSQRGGTDRGRRITERERRLAIARQSQEAGLPARKRVIGQTAVDHDRSDDAWQGNRWAMGSRPCATFAYIGPAMDRSDALRLLAPYLKRKDSP
jgi:hypothetical protein